MPPSADQMVALTAVWKAPMTDEGSVAPLAGCLVDSSVPPSADQTVALTDVWKVLTTVGHSAAPFVSCLVDSSASPSAEQTVVMTAVWKATILQQQAKLFVSNDVKSVYCLYQWQQRQHSY